MQAPRFSAPVRAGKFLTPHGRWSKDESRARRFDALRPQDGSDAEIVRAQWAARQIPATNQQGA